MTAPFDAAALAHEAVELATQEARGNTDPRPPKYSDDALALAFSARHDGQLLYVPTWGHWLRWDGCRWAQDDVLTVFDLARGICRATAASAAKEDEKAAQAIASSGTVAAVEKLARCDPRHARKSGDFDADPWALNTPDGVLDLRTGTMRPHQHGEMVTKVTAVAPGGECPTWHRFLDEITHGDAELIAFLQRFIGYTLTGDISEHAFVFLHGPGGNGKSVLLSTIAAALGDYATTAMDDVFVVAPGTHHQTHEAALRGARMVMVPETEEGRPRAESKIKTLTGGDKISARVMRGDPFEFSPQFKLWIAGNHRPVLRNPDPAMRRRLHLVPLTFVPTVPDTRLPEKLRTESGGILAWAIQGCLAWQRAGLQPPETVKQATTAYFSEQDSIAAWLAERCEPVPRAEMGSATAFADWSVWAKARGEDPGTAKRFSGELERHAMKKKTKTGAVFVGFRLRPSESGTW